MLKLNEVVIIIQVKDAMKAKNQVKKELGIDLLKLDEYDKTQIHLL